MKTQRIKPAKFPPILGGFIPVAALWEEAAAGGLFPSEQSARWYLRVHRDELFAAGAVAMHLGRLHIHPERLQEVARRIALHAARSGVRSGA